MRFLFGVFVGILLVAVGAAAFVYTGSFNTSAEVPPGRLERRLATLALDKSVARRAPKKQNPLPANAETLAGGLREFRGHCLVCHGAPGIDPSAIGQGLNPGAPDLTLPRIQARSDGELFWIIDEGIRMTGMPAFGPTQDEKELWEMVAFVRHLPEITDDEKAKLKGEGVRGRGETPPGGDIEPAPTTPPPSK